MKLLTSQNIQVIALSILGLLVALAAARYLYKEGFQNAPTPEEAPLALCRGVQTALDLKRKDLENSKSESDVKFNQQILRVLEKQFVDNNCAQYAAEIAAIPTEIPK
jgi:hypothetical protein